MSEPVDCFTTAQREEIESKLGPDRWREFVEFWSRPPSPPRPPVGLVEPLTWERIGRRLDLSDGTSVELPMSDDEKRAVWESINGGGT